MSELLWNIFFWVSGFAGGLSVSFWLYDREKKTRRTIGFVLPHHRR